jgi:hypothetical protein
LDKSIALTSKVNKDNASFENQRVKIAATYLGRETRKDRAALIEKFTHSILFYGGTAVL